MDITTNDHDGRESGFNNLEMIIRAARRVLQDEPMLFIGGHVCTAFCKLIKTHYTNMPQEEVERRMSYGRGNFACCAIWGFSGEPVDISSTGAQPVPARGGSGAYNDC